MKSTGYLFSALIIAVLMPGLLFALGDRKAHLEFLPMPRIEDQTIELREVCDIHCEDPYFLEQLRSVTIAAAPQPGLERTMTKYEILASLKREGISTRDIQFTGKVKTKFSCDSENILPSEIIQVAREYVLSETGYDSENVIIEAARKPQEILVPSGKRHYEIYPLSTGSMIGKVFLSVNLIMDGNIRETIPVTLNVRLFKEVLIAKKNIGRGNNIRISDFDMRKREVTRFKKGVVEDFDDVHDMVPKRTIRTQQILTMDMFEYPELIRRGEIVKIILQSGSMTVTAKGIALNGGKKGEIVRVRNIDSKRIITAVVSGKGLARLNI